MAEFATIPVTPRFSVVLGNRSFLALWTGQLLSQLADRIYIYVLLIAAYQMTHTNLGVSIPMLAFGAASVLFGVMAGVYVDRADHKKTLVGTNWIRAVGVLATYPFLDNSLVMLFVLSFCIYTATQFFAPAEAASIPELISKENLVVANSLFMTTWIGSSVMGIGLGAPLVMFLGSAGTLTLSAALYVLAGVLILFVPLPKRVRRSPGAPVRSSVWSEVSMGLEFVRRNAVVATALFKMFVASAALAVVSLLALTFARDVLKIGEHNFGYLIFAAGAGMIAGTVFLSHFSHRIPKWLIAVGGFGISGVFLILLATVRDVGSALVVSFFLGFGDILVVVVVQTILQHYVPRPMRGRVFGIQNMLINSAFTFPVVVFGGLADWIGLPVSFVSLGILVLLVGTVGMLRPSFRAVQ